MINEVIYETQYLCTILLLYRDQRVILVPREGGEILASLVCKGCLELM